MEMWARYAHKALWHDFEPGWRLHKSHHVPRLGAFEDNDVFAIINAVPAMGLCAYGFLTPNVIGGGCHSSTLPSKEVRDSGSVAHCEGMIMNVQTRSCQPWPDGMRQAATSLPCICLAARDGSEALQLRESAAGVTRHLPP